MWHLNNPAFLYALLIPLLGASYFLLKPRRASASLFIFPLSKSVLSEDKKKTVFRFRIIFTVFILALCILVCILARPAAVKTWTKKWTEGVDIAIVLDVSESMEADDLSPTRIIAAKKVIRDFINRRPYDRIGLVIFGGEAIMKSPLTRDFDFLLNQVEDIRLRELKQGTAIGMGIANGIARLRKSESKNKVIILLTDGDSNVGAINPVTAAKLARQEGIRIYTIGIGKEDRVVVPIYAYDLEGRRTHLITQVPSYLNPKLLTEVATLTGGRSYMARDTGMLASILKEIDRLEKTKIHVQPMTETEELYLIPGILATALLFLYYLLTETRFKTGIIRPKLQLEQV